MRRPVRLLAVGATLGVVSLAIFAGLHSLVVKPIWSQLLGGLPFVLAIGITALAASTIGYFLRPCSWLERGLLLAAALMLISGQLITDVAGIAVIGGLFVWQYLKNQRSEVALTPPTPKEPA